LKALLALPGFILVMVGCPERIPLETPRAPADFTQVIRFVANPRIIHPGEKVVLGWDARKAREVILEQAVDPQADIRAAFQQLGTFPASGTLEVHPKTSTTYVVSYDNETIGCSSASVQIIVK